MSSPPKNNNNNNNQDSVRHSRPIPINIGRAGNRRRSVSVTSSDSSGSPTSPPQPQTPLSCNSSPPRIPTNLSPSSSPILSYFMSQSPTKTAPAPATFPFNRKFGGAPPVFEEEETVEEVPVAVHARRASTAGRFGPQQPAPVMPDPQCERGTALLRRLSLGNAFARTAPTGRIPSPPRPNTPPNTAVDSGNGYSKMPNVNAQGARVRRSATLNVDGGGRTRRAPSPMGERILKGHFDGFN